jgi:hypothetical protein
MNMNFDPAKLTATSVTEGGFLKDWATANGDYTISTMQVGDHNIQAGSAIDNAGGHITNISCAIMGRANLGGPSGTGTLCTISFTAYQDVNDTCTITPVSVIVSDTNGATILGVAVNTGSVIIGDISTPTPTPTQTPSQKPVSTPTYTPTATSTPTNTPNLGNTPTTLTFNLTGLTDSKGALIKDYQDEKAGTGNSNIKTRLEMKKGTVALTVDKKPVESISVTQTSLPEGLSNGRIIVAAFEYGPNGSTFSPPINLSIQYDPALLPKGVLEQDLVLAYYDIQQKTWVDVDCKVDPANHTVIAQVSHFTLFAIMPKSAPPINWGMLGGIAAAGILVVIAIVFYIIRKRRTGMTTALTISGRKSTLEDYMASSLPALYGNKNVPRKNPPGGKDPRKKRQG